jgi:NADH-quinone oxidoreductase subunit G
MAEQKTDSITLTIDDRQVSVPRGTTILKAAEQLGIGIPHFCYHPDLSVAGVCRMCLVEIEKMPKPVSSCSTPVGEGMVVRTGRTSEQVRTAVKEVLELHFINHPTDCPICDQAGECRLQEYYWEWGLYLSRFKDDKVVHPKHTNIGPMVVLDADRCIHCSRCVRFCKEVPKTEELCIVNRGDHAEITLGTGKRLDNPYSANVVDICPVGAHTLRDFRFQCRVWNLERTPSVCPVCARGCSISVEHAKGRVHRITPRRNPLVNGRWMCDAGRLAHHRITEGKRLAAPMVREGAELKDTTWDDALAAVKVILAEAGEGLVGIVSPDATNEEAYLLARLLEKAKSKKLGSGTSWEPRGGDDALLRRADLSANRTGVRRIVGEASFSDVVTGARAVVVLGGDPLSGAPSDAASAFKGIDSIVVLSSHLDDTSRAATVALPIAGFAERDGTVTNFLGHTQVVGVAVPPPGEARPAAAVLAALLESLGEKKVKADTASVFDEIVKKVGGFKGLKYASLGELGAGGAREEKS